MKHTVNGLTEKQTGEYKTIRENRLIIAVTVLIFICMYAFYAVAHPLYIYDKDDWFYVTVRRHPFPYPGWNPCRVLPETLMPFVAQIGVSFIMPFTGDYIGSMAYAFALAVSLFISAYILAFGMVFKKVFGLGDKTLSVILAILLLLHFLPLNPLNIRVGDIQWGIHGDIQYLFYAGNASCYFYYIIPALLNAITVMYLMTHRCLEWRARDKVLRNGIVLLALYLSVFSSLLHNIVLMAFIGMRMIVSLARSLHFKKEDGRKYDSMIHFWENYMKENVFEWSVSAVWLLSAVMEAGGGRAQAGKAKFLPMESIKGFVDSVMGMNELFLLGSFALFLLAAVVLTVTKRRNKDEEIDRIYGEWCCGNLICLVLSVVYLILLCARVEPDYIKRADVMISWMLYFFLLEMGTLAYLIKKLPVTACILPLTLYVLAFETVIDSGVYRDSFVVGYSAETVKALDDYIVRQVVEAEEAGEDSVEVHVPLTSREDWPIGIAEGDERISLTLYRHGITHRRMKVRLVMDPSVNEKFALGQGWDE